MEAVRSNKADLRKLERFGFLVRRWDDSEDKVEVVGYVAGGAVVGAGVAALVVGMGLAVGGTAVAIVASPVIAASAVVGLAAYRLKNLNKGLK
jgi:hypothetical protein